MTKPIVAIIGATGGQGGSVASSFLADGNYTVRGITRNPSSEKALALKNKGAELASADVNNLDSLVEAFKGASIIFAVTDFFEPFIASGPEAAIKVEVTQGINLAKAASLTPTLTHYIWSTLPPAARLTNNKYPVPHFIGKSQVDDFIKSDPALYAKTTFLWVAWFISNIQWGFNRPFLCKTAGKYLQISPVPPSTPVLTIGSHTANIGPFVLAIAKQPSLTHGKFVLASAGAWETMGSLLDRWSKITGKETEYIQVGLEQYDRLWPQWGKEIGLMLQFWEEYGDKSWTGEEVLDGEALGVKGLVDAQGALEELDYSDI